MASSLPTSTPTAFDSETIAERISRLNYELTLLPEVGAPAPSQNVAARTDDVRREVARLFAYADGDPSNSKWSLISHYTRTIGGRAEMKSAVTTGNQRKHRPKTAEKKNVGRVPVLPETEAEWARLERRGTKRKRSPATVPVVKKVPQAASKVVAKEKVANWQEDVTHAQTLSAVEEKVKRWQAGIKNVTSPKPKRQSPIAPKRGSPKVPKTHRPVAVPQEYDIDLNELSKDFGSPMRDVVQSTQREAPAEPHGNGAALGRVPSFAADRSSPPATPQLHRRIIDIAATSGAIPPVDSTDAPVPSSSLLSSVPITSPPRMRAKRLPTPPSEPRPKRDEEGRRTKRRRIEDEEAEPTSTPPAVQEVLVPSTPVQVRAPFTTPGTGVRSIDLRQMSRKRPARRKAVRARGLVISSSQMSVESTTGAKLDRPASPSPTGRSSPVPAPVYAEPPAPKVRAAVRARELIPSSSQMSVDSTTGARPDVAKLDRPAPSPILAPVVAEPPMPKVIALEDLETRPEQAGSSSKPLHVAPIVPDQDEHMATPTVTPQKPSVFATPRKPSLDSAVRTPGPSPTKSQFSSLALSDDSSSEEGDAASGLFPSYGEFAEYVGGQMQSTFPGTSADRASLGRVGSMASGASRPSVGGAKTPVLANARSGFPWVNTLSSGGASGKGKLKEGRTGSAFIGSAGMYNSQFDVDGGVGLASALLEKDENWMELMAEEEEAE